MSSVRSKSSFALAFTFTLGVVERAAYSSSVSFVRGRLSELVSVKSSVPGVNGLGNFPGKSLGVPLLFACIPFLPSLSMTCAPKVTVFLPLLDVPGVMRIPVGFVGDCDAISFLEGGSMFLTLAVSSFTFLSLFFTVSFWGGAGVPKRACLKARSAKTGAGVSGGSINVVSKAGSA